jgi:hypothetical protein
MLQYLAMNAAMFFLFSVTQESARNSRKKARAPVPDIDDGMVTLPVYLLSHV